MPLVVANEEGKRSKVEGKRSLRLLSVAPLDGVAGWTCLIVGRRSEMEISTEEGESPVAPCHVCESPHHLESRSLGILRKVGGKFHQNLNMTQRPIAKKYCEGTLKRIVKTKLNSA